MRKRKEAEKEREEEEQRKYNAFKARLIEGVPMRYFEIKSRLQKECVMFVDLKDPKHLVVKGPKMKSTIKFDLMFLFRIHSGWTSPSMKEVGGGAAQRCRSGDVGVARKWRDGLAAG